MSDPRFLTIGRVERRLSTGDTESLSFDAGVNLLVGRPNTGKTKWLQTIDHLFGDPDSFDTSFEEHLAEKYDAARAELFVGSDRLLIERRWKEPGVKTRIFVNGDGLLPRDFQHLLMEKLGLPGLHFPKGNPMSGQTWPELSFRMLLRHIYRQQRFWSGIADLQPDAEQHACLLQFLGVAQNIFTDDYGEFVRLRMKVEALKVRREQYTLTLNELARDVLSDPQMQLGVTPASVRLAEARLEIGTAELRTRRTSLIETGRDRIVAPEVRTRIQQLSESRASVIVRLEELKRRNKATRERLDEMRRYRASLADEIDRIARAEDAGAALADLRITHCPACDQPIHSTAGSAERCFLCNQRLPDEPSVDELGSVRLRFERDRLAGELKEAEELITVLDRDAKRHAREIGTSEEQLRMLENELAPARQAVSALIQDGLSAIDMALGELSERQRQLGRLKNALAVGQALTNEIAKIERELAPLDERVNQGVRATDFDAAGEKLAQGMNAYLISINTLRPGIWRHSAVSVDLSRSGFAMRVGARRWSTALGGTDTLYFLMAYHYGLMTLSDQEGCHYPGLSIIDLPGEFLGELVEDKENFIVQPFIDLLSKDEYQGAQVILAGASFVGLNDVKRISLTDVYAG